MQDMATIIAEAVAAAIAANTPAELVTVPGGTLADSNRAAAKVKAKRSGGKRQSGAKATPARKATDKATDKAAYKPTAAKRREAATARQLWALNQAGMLVLDTDGGNKPVAFGVAFDCVAATRK